MQTFCLSAIFLTLTTKIYYEKIQCHALFFWWSYIDRILLQPHENSPLDSLSPTSFSYRMYSVYACFLDNSPSKFSDRCHLIEKVNHLSIPAAWTVTLWFSWSSLTNWSRNAGQERVDILLNYLTSSSKTWTYSTQKR